MITNKVSMLIDELKEKNLEGLVHEFDANIVAVKFSHSSEWNENDNLALMTRKCISWFCRQI